MAKEELRIFFFDPYYGIAILTKQINMNNRNIPPEKKSCDGGIIGIATYNMFQKIACCTNTEHQPRKNTHRNFSVIPY